MVVGGTDWYSDGVQTVRVAQSLSEVVVRGLLSYCRVLSQTVSATQVRSLVRVCAKS